MNLKDKTNMSVARLLVILLIACLATALLTTAFNYVATSEAPDTNLALDVEIQPRDVKLVVGQVRTFWAIVHNGSSPYDAEWFSNGTFLDSGLTVDFSFKQSCSYTILSVYVEDTRGNVGYNETTVYDPTYITSGSFASDYSYLVSMVNSTHYQAQNGTTGTVDETGTNLATILNNADNNLPIITGSERGGQIVLNLVGYHDIGSALALGRKTVLSGLGSHTILNVTANINCIEIDGSTNDASWVIENLQIDMNQKSGHGIYSGHACSVSAWDYNMPRITNVAISYVKAGYSGIYVKDIYLMHFENIWVMTYGTGIYIGHSNGDSMNWGNSHFDRVMIDLKGNDAVGVDVVDGTSYNSMTLTSFDWLQVFTSGGKTGTIGVRIDGQYYTTFMQLIIENCNVSLHLDGTREVSVFNPTILNSGTYSVLIEGDTFGTNFKGGRFGGAYWDDSSASGNDGKNIIDGTFLITNVNNGQWDWTQWAFGTVTYNDGGTYYLDNYETDTSGWSNPHGPTWEGRVVSMYNGDQSPAYRTWTYLNGGWRYEELT